MKYSPHNKTYRDYIENEVEKVMRNLDLQNKSKESWIKKIFKSVYNKIKLCMSYLKWKW